MKTHYYDTQKNQILLTSLLFDRRPFCSNHFELYNLMRAGRKQDRNITGRRKDQIVRILAKNNMPYAAKQLEITFRISLTLFKAFLKL